MENVDVIIIGTGELGLWVVELLARAEGMAHKKILVADVNEESARKRTFSAWAGTSFLGQSPVMEHVRLDMFDVDRTGEVLRKCKPKLVCNCTSLQSWWVVGELPKDIYTKIEVEAGLGPWIPMHLTLTYELMKAIKKYEIDTHVVNCSFPDLTNPALGKIGLAPTCGIGNADHMFPGVRRAVAKRLNVPPCNITMYLVAHHSHNMQFWLTGKSGSPYYLKIMVGDKDVTKQFNTDEIWLEGINDWLPGTAQHPFTASSVVKNIWHLIFDTGELSFAPGPNGEVGGYPIRMSAKGVEIILPEGITLDEARKINYDAQTKDGVETIKEDGTIVFTDPAHSIMKELMGYDCKSLKVEESKERAKELMQKYAELRKKYSG